jgi:hypothetical protein
MRYISEVCHFHVCCRKNLKLHVNKIYNNSLRAGDGLTAKHVDDTTKDNANTHAPNVVLEWLTVLLRIREVLGSNLDTETGHPD